jgi:starvation-inducible DNA-binding protein
MKSAGKFDLPEKNRKQVAGQLNILLASEYMLYTKTLKYHWNVTGKHFGPLHHLFNKQYEQLLTIADNVAERVRALGFATFGTLEEFSKHSILEEQPGKNPDDMTIIKLLTKDHEAVTEQIRNDAEEAMELGDAGTNNFLTELLVEHEKMAWMLRAHLE